MATMIDSIDESDFSIKEAYVIKKGEK